MKGEKKSSKLISFLLFHTGIFILQQNKTIFLFLRKYVLVINVYEKERKKKTFRQNKNGKRKFIKMHSFHIVNLNLNPRMLRLEK